MNKTEFTVFKAEADAEFSVQIRNNLAGGGNIQHNFNLTDARDFNVTEHNARRGAEHFSEIKGNGGVEIEIAVEFNEVRAVARFDIVIEFHFIKVSIYCNGDAVGNLDLF